jgi:hypothetical protein
MSRLASGRQTAEPNPTAPDQEGDAEREDAATLPERRVPAVRQPGRRPDRRHETGDRAQRPDHGGQPCEKCFHCSICQRHGLLGLTPQLSCRVRAGREYAGDDMMLPTGDQPYACRPVGCSATLGRSHDALPRHDLSPAAANGQVHPGGRRDDRDAVGGDLDLESRLAQPLGDEVDLRPRREIVLPAPRLERDDRCGVRRISEPYGCLQRVPRCGLTPQLSCGLSADGRD